MYAGFSIITAARRTFPTWKIILDAWHLDQNQKRHISAYKGTAGCAALSKNMSSDLYRLRNSSTVVTLTRRRREFGLKYFGYTGLPESGALTREGEDVDEVDDGEEDRRNDDV